MLTILTGLPGSGKTTYLREHFKDCFIDDYKGHALGRNSGFAASRHFCKLINSLTSSDWVISDIDFCRKRARDEVEEILGELLPELEIKWIFFENNPRQCKWNCKCQSLHNYKNRRRAIKRYSKIYNPPEGCLPVKGPKIPSMISRLMSFLRISDV